MLYAGQHYTLSQPGVGGDGAGLGTEMGKGSGVGQGQGQSRGAVCPGVSMAAPGLCTAPEGRPPSFLVRAFLLSAAHRVGRRSGNAIGDGGWAPDGGCGAGLEGARPAEELGCPGHTHECPVHGYLALRSAGTGLAWQLAVTKAWPHLDGFGLVLVFRLETAWLG